MAKLNDDIDDDYDAKRDKRPNRNEDLRTIMSFFRNFFNGIIWEITGADFAATISFRI